MPPQQQPQPQILPKPSGSKISNAEWGLVIGATAAIDLIQFLLDFFLVGALVNRFIDIGVGASLAFYFWIRKVKMDQKKIITLVGSFLGEEIPALDALPLWTADVIATMLWDKADKKLANLPI